MFVFFEHNYERFLCLVEIVFEQVDLRTLNVGGQELFVGRDHLVADVQCFLAVVGKLLVIQKSHLIEH